jgi:hypothetical protein
VPTHLARADLSEALGRPEAAASHYRAAARMRGAAG